MTGAGHCHRVAVRICVGLAGGGPRANQGETRRYLGLHTAATVSVIELHAAGPVAFNALAAGSDADVVVLLEAGALVGPRWLDHLSAALERPGCGLAGPSTNRAWNEQACVRGARADLTSVRRDAARLSSRYGAAARSLAPLHSLGDFCFAVRREVIDAVGAADPAYQEGPCWEMDYSARAARAGFAGLWAGAAYVYRSPVPVSSPQADLDAQEQNLRIYQDRLCGLRLRGTADGYREHCLGDACEHFAPADLITIRLPLTAPREHESVGIPPPVPAAASPTPARRALPFRAKTSAPPLVSALMVTRDRPELALKAVEYFQRQDYSNRELVIIEDGAPLLAQRLPRDPRVRLVSSGLTRSIGEMRNHACRQGGGALMMLWDDDDWHGPTRITDQVAPLIAGRCDLTGLTDLTWFEVDGWRAWRLTPRLASRMLLRDVYAGTLAFHRSVWEKLARFPDRSLAEDAAFLSQALRRGARLERMEGSTAYVYVRHGRNTWRVGAGTDVDSAGWLPAGIPALPVADHAFYRHLGLGCTSTLPLVSCIMPTADRRRFVPRALEYFARQDYPSRELVIIDDGDDPVDDIIAALAPAGLTVNYHRPDRRLVLGAKRNLACEVAAGEIIAHWDDDDWQSPTRLGIQARALEATGLELSGMRSLLFYDGGRGQAWRYRWPGGRKAWAAGTSLMYTSERWRRVRFSDVANGEDTRFVWRTPNAQVADVSDSACVIAIIHRGNTVPKAVRGAYWSAVPTADVELLLGEDAAFYLGTGSTPFPARTALAGRTGARVRA
ncbi:MAG TPA: glycosyltransferase [Dermatophilaceae bacterium]